MDLREKEFLEQLSNLSYADLKKWIRYHYTANNFYVKSPFDGLNDPLNVLDRTLELININRYKHSYSVIETFEDALVEIFAEITSHPILHPDVSLKFLSIFINCPPIGKARSKLTDFLISLTSRRTLKGVKAGNRDLHFDSLELLTKLSLTTNETIIENKEIGEFLMLGLLSERDPRFCVITLTYFKNARSVDDFFKAFDISIELLPLEKITVVLDVLTSMYWKDKTISWKFFANWTTLQISKDHKNQKFISVCGNEKLFKLIVQRWEENADVNLTSGRNEGQYLIGLIVLMKAVCNKKLLSPRVIAELFLNELENNNQELLNELYYELPGASEPLLQSFIAKKRFLDFYPIFHIAVIYMLKNSLYVQDDEFALIENEVDIEIEKESIPPSFRIQNLNGNLLDSVYNWPIPMEVIVSTPINDVRMSFLWWTNAKLCIANTKVYE